MVYIVERYLPGLAGPELEQALESLPAVTERMRREGTPVRYLGSTIVPQDEACFCQFEASSETAVAEANRRAHIAFDRIVHGINVAPAVRSAHEEEQS